MEDEAFFLWVKYRVQNLPPRIENDREIVDYQPVIRTVALRKDVNPDFLYKRVHVDFDPTSKQNAFVLVINASTEEGRVVYREHFHFPTITETLEQAEEEKRKIEAGGYRPFLQKRQKFQKVDIMPVVIAAV